MHIKNSLSAIAIAAVLAAGTAQAADLPSHKAAPDFAPPPPVFSWTGFYVGLNAGGGFKADSGAGEFSGVVGGGQIGYNLQLAPMFVVGLEADFQGTSLGSNTGWLAPKVSLPWFGTVRGRAGVHPVRFQAAGLRHGRLRLWRAEHRLAQRYAHRLDRRRRRRMGVPAQLVGQGRISLHRPRERQELGLGRAAAHQVPHGPRRRELSLQPVLIGSAWPASVEAGHARKQKGRSGRRLASPFFCSSRRSRTGREISPWRPPPLPRRSRWSLSRCPRRAHSGRSPSP